MTNQYEPWKELGIDECEYWKRRYLSMSRENGVIEKCLFQMQEAAKDLLAQLREAEAGAALLRATLNQIVREECCEAGSELCCRAAEQAHRTIKDTDTGKSALAVIEWAKANIPEMDCRSDEDCDHCVGVQLLAAHDAAMKGDA